MKLKYFFVKGNGNGFKLNPNPKLADEPVSEQIRLLKEDLKKQGVVGVEIDPVFEDHNHGETVNARDLSLEALVDNFLSPKERSKKT